MKKYIFSSILLLAGCSNGVSINETQSSINEMEERISKLEAQNENLNTALEIANSQLEDLKEENTEKTEKIEALTADNEVLNERIYQTQAEFVSKPTQTPQAQPKVSANNPPGVFTTGSSQDHVKSIMGNPDSVMNNGISVYWRYGQQAWISFDSNGLVDSWYDFGDTLKHE